MKRIGPTSVAIPFLLGILFVLPRPAATDAGNMQHPHFPEPTALAPNVAFWKQVYTEYGVGDFVLHDRDNLAVMYDVVRVGERTNQARAEQLAKPAVERARGKYRDILIRLADGTAPEDLGADGRRVADARGCPCAPDSLRRAAENIRVQQGLREKVDEGLRRARRLMPQIVSILRRHDLPAELAALPLVESTFNPAARSKAGAVGLWQFIRSTGKRYLTITRRRDERRDPIRATEAAAHLLRNNYAVLGSWPLAIVAYNHGHAGVRAASSMVGSTAIEDIVARYDGPRFGFASKNFYAEFLAALDVVYPLLHGDGKPSNGKGHRRSVSETAMSTRPGPGLGLFPSQPPAAPGPAEIQPAIQGPAPSESERVVEPPVGAEQGSLAPDVLAPPPLDGVDPSAVSPLSVESVQPRHAEPPGAGTYEQNAALPEPTGPPAVPAPESDATPPPPTRDAARPDVPPCEIQESSSSEPLEF